MVIVGGMIYRGGKKLWPKRGEFYHYVGVDMLVRGGVVFTSQKPANVTTGVKRSGYMPGVDRNPPCGRP